MDITLRHSRQAQIVAHPRGKRMLVIGAGSIGSNAAHVAAGLGFENITIVDNDAVAEENLYPAFLANKDIGENKAVAVVNDLKDRYNIEAAAISQRVPSWLPDEPFEIVVIGTDTKSSRKQILSHMKQLCSGWLIDARMGGTECQVYTIDVNDEDVSKYYTESFTDAPEVPLPCGEKATASITKGYIPGMIGLSLTRILNGGEPLPPIYQQFELKSAMMIVTTGGV